MHTIEIERTNPTTYTVWYNGSVLIKHSRNPEFDACRALLEKGITGRLLTRHRGSNVISFVLDIQKAAELTVLEGQGTPRLGKFFRLRGTRGRAFLTCLGVPYRKNANRRLRASVGP